MIVSAGNMDVTVCADSVEVKVWAGKVVVIAGSVIVEAEAVTVLVMKSET